MFTGCPAPGAYGCAPQSHLCDSASSGIWLQPRMNRRDIPPAPGHGLKLQQLPRVTQYSCGDFTSCACSRPSHRPGSCVDMLGAATALFQTKPKAPSKQRNKAGLAKPESDQITSSCSSAGWALASVAGGRLSSLSKVPHGSAAGIKALGKQIPVAQPALQPQGITNTYLNHLAGFTVLPEIPVMDATSSLTSVSLPAFI